MGPEPQQESQEPPEPPEAQAPQEQEEQEEQEELRTRAARAWEILQRGHTGTSPYRRLYSYVGALPTSVSSCSARLLRLGLVADMKARVSKVSDLLRSSGRVHLEGGLHAVAHSCPQRCKCGPVAGSGFRGSGYTVAWQHVQHAS